MQLAQNQTNPRKPDNNAHAKATLLPAAWEAFAREYAIGKNAGNATKAAEIAGYKPGKSSSNMGSLLRKKPDVLARIHELQLEAAESAGDDLQAHLKQLQTIRDNASDAKQLTAAARAEELRGKALGFYVERLQIESAIPDSDLLTALARVLPGEQVSVFAAVLRASKGASDTLDVAPGETIEAEAVRKSTK